jgi:hypothetical protein
MNDFAGSLGSDARRWARLRKRVSGVALSISQADGEVLLVA